MKIPRVDKSIVFGVLWRMLCVNWPPPEPEYRFDEKRDWRFDFAWPEHRLAVEVDGGQWMAHGGRHSRDSDREKLNAAAAQGWRILRFSPEMLERDPDGCMILVRQAMLWKKPDADFPRTETRSTADA